MKTDPSTGLPEVPEGMYWEVARAKMPPRSLDCMRIALMASDGTQVAYVLAHDLTKNLLAYTYVRPRHIRKAAKACMRRYLRTVQAAELEGTYPPKKLGA